MKPTLGQILSSDYRQHPRYRGCVGHWMMVEGGGAALYDLSGYGTRGTINGAVWTSGQNGPTLDFNGTTDDVNLGNPTCLQITGAISICAYVCLDSAPDFTNHQILAKDGDTGGRAYTFDYETSPGNIVRLYVNGGGGTSEITEAALTVGVWTRLVVAFDARGFMGIYRNGRLTASRTDGPTSIPTATANVLIGQRERAAELGNFNGKIDDVRIYNRALTPGEVMSLHEDPFLEFESVDEIAYTQFIETPATNLMSQIIM